MKTKTISTVCVLLLVLAGSIVFLVQQLLKIHPLQPIDSPVIAHQPTAPSAWNTYTDPVHLFSVHYPNTSTTSAAEPAPWQSGAERLLHISTASELAIGSLIVARSDDPITGVTISASRDIEHCLTFQETASSTIETINAIPFKVASWGDAAMGGERGIIQSYHTVRNNLCYIIESAVHYRDVAFLAGVTGVAPRTASPAELDEQAQWISTQQALQQQIIRTFIFTQ